jgi:hypothetical protein
MKRGKYYMLSGRDVVPVDALLEWARWYETADRQIALDALSGSTVSTVFLGLDFNHLRNGPPLVFETMIFGGLLDGFQCRYSTYAQALGGHAHALAEVKAMIADHAEVSAAAATVTDEMLKAMTEKKDK